MPTDRLPPDFPGHLEQAPAFGPGEDLPVELRRLRRRILHPCRNPAPQVGLHKKGDDPGASTILVVEGDLPFVDVPQVDRVDRFVLRVRGRFGHRDHE